MNELIAALIVVCFSFATGIFYVLSCLEKPVWSLMLDAGSDRVEDEQARFVHQALQRLIPFLPPTMITTILTGFALILLQSWLRDFDRSSLILIGFFLVVAGYLFPRLPGRVKGVSEVPHDGKIRCPVRHGTACGPAPCRDILRGGSPAAADYADHRLTGGFHKLSSVRRMFYK